MEKHIYILLGKVDSYTNNDLEKLEGKTFDYIEDIDGFDGVEIRTLSEFIEDLNMALYPQEHYVTYIYLRNKTDLWQL